MCTNEQLCKSYSQHSGTNRTKPSQMLAGITKQLGNMNPTARFKPELFYNVFIPFDRLSVSLEFRFLRDSPSESGVCVGFVLWHLRFKQCQHVPTNTFG